MEWIPVRERNLLRSFTDLVRPVVVYGGILLTVSGCSGWRQSTTSEGGLASMFRPKLSKVSYEENVEEIPEKPNDPEGLKLAYARWMEEVDQPHEARSNYSAVVSEDPDNVDAILGLARLDQLAGSTQEAERRFLQALKLAPENAFVQYELGRFYASQSRWQEAVTPLQKAMLNDPLTKQYRHQLAIAQVHAGDVHSAIPNFSQTIGDAEAHYNVALILKEMGDLTQAEHQLIMALTKRPDFEPAQRWLNEVRRQRGMLARATAPQASSTGTILQASASIAPEHSIGRVTPALATEPAPAHVAVPQFQAPRHLPAQR